MSLFWSLFTARRPLRHYARLDQTGICLALKHCGTPPTGEDWVEVNEQRLAWLNQPLPASALVHHHRTRPSPRQLLTA